MRMSRRLGMGGGLQDLPIIDSISLNSSAWYKRIDSREDHDTWVQGEPQNWSTTVDLTKYSYVRFTVTEQHGGCYIEAGGISVSNPSVGDGVIDISSIADRSSIIVHVHLDAAHASRPSYYPATNTASTQISITSIRATRE